MSKTKSQLMDELEGMRERVAVLEAQQVDRKRIKASLRDSEERYRTLFAEAPVSVTIVDTSGVVVDCNEATAALTGFSKEEIQGKRFDELMTLDPKDLPKLMESHDRNIRGEDVEPFDLEIIRKDGGRRWILVKVSLFKRRGKVSGIQIYAIDITERRLAEEELRLIRVAVDSSSDAIGMSDPQGNHFYQNRAFTALFEYTAEELHAAGGGPAAYVDREVARDVFDTIMSGGSWHGEVEMLSKEGREFPVLLRADAIKDTDGNIIGLIGMHTDITERRKVLAELRIKDDAIASSINAVALSDLDGKLNYVNDSFLEIWGYESRDEIIGKPATEFWRSKQQAGSILEAVLRKGGARGELVAVRKDGATFSAEISMSLVTDDDDNPLCIMGSFIDMTERKAAEKALRESEEKLRAMFDASPDFIMNADREGKILFINRTVPELTIEETLGTSLYEYIAPEARDDYKKALTQVFQSGDPVNIETAGLGPGGRMSYYRTRFSPIIHGSQVYTVMIVATDVTEHKRAEDALLESEGKFRTIFESIGDAVTVVDLSGKVIDLNRAALRIFGVKNKKKAIGADGFSFIAERSHKKAMDDMMKLFEAGERGPIEYTFQTADGREFEVESSNALLRDADGNPTGIVSINRDITERKQVEEQLRILSSVVEQSTSSIAIMDTEGVVEYMNPALLEVYKVVPDEIIGKNWRSFLSKYSSLRAKLPKMRDSVLLRGEAWQGEVSDISASGETVWRLATILPIKGKGGQIARIAYTSEDITARKQVEEELRSSEEKLRFMFESLDDGIIVVDLDGRIEEVNEATLRLAGCSNKEDIIGRNVFDFVAEKDRVRALEENAKNIMEEHGSAVEYTAVDINGREFDVESTGALVRDSSGNPVGFITAVRDVTERKRIEEALRESEERYRSVVETASDAIISIDSNGHITFWNTAAEAIFGYSGREILGKPLDMLVPEQFRAGLREGLGRLVSPAKVTGIGRTMELVGRKKDGSEFPVEHSMATWQAEGEGFHTAIIRDITERKKAEAALRDSEEKLRVMFESIADGIVMTDLMGNIIDVNGAALRLHGHISKEEMVGQKGLDLLSDQYKATAIENVLKALREGCDAITEYTLQRPDKTEVDMEGIVNVLHDSSGEAAGMVVITRDITERKRAEENLKLYVKEITRAQEEERKRIARDLHDETVQELAALALDIEAVKRGDKRLSADTANSLECIQEKSRSIMEGVSRFSAELRPDVLDQMGLLSALSWLVENIGDEIDVRVELSGDERRLPSEVELVLFRVAQEALSNVKKHSGATKAVAKVAFTVDGVRLEVRDYGKGFVMPDNIADLAAGGHLGILGMHERARIIGGIMSVRSRPGEGTSVSIVV